MMFRPRFCTVKDILGRRQSGRMKFVLTVDHYDYDADFTCCSSCEDQHITGIAVGTKLIGRQIEGVTALLSQPLEGVVSGSGSHLQNMEPKHGNQEGYGSMNERMVV